MNTSTSIKSITSFIIILLCITLTTVAQTTTHTVQKGETLFNIAQQYNVEVEQLKQWNDIQADQLAVGQTLVIREASPKNGPTHTVQPQETLFSISKKYNVSIAEIKSWNNLESNNLSVGQKLTIYPSEENNSEQQSIVVDNETQKNTYYTVKSGDSLFRIAQEHDMEVEELKELNNLSSNTIRVGQKLTVRDNETEAPPSVETSIESSPQGKFATYKISGNSETIQEIITKFKMDEEEFRALNSGIDGTTLQPGRTVTVLAPANKNYSNPYLSNANMQSLGTASVSRYSKSEQEKPTTNGELYNPKALTAAHSNIAMGSVIFIENPENKIGIYVRINDRNSGNGLKLSDAAWQVLQFKSSNPSVTIYQDQ
jgi:LysM repeat protein